LSDEALGTFDQRRAQWRIDGEKRPTDMHTVDVQKDNKTSTGERKENAGANDRREEH
jgi:hypothetical protein